MRGAKPNIDCYIESFALDHPAKPLLAIGLADNADHASVPLAEREMVVLDESTRYAQTRETSLDGKVSMKKPRESP